MLRNKLFRHAVIGIAGVLMGATSVTGIAAAAPDPLERFERQAVEWRACGVEVLDASAVQCADITVPLDYSRPEGRTITVAISRMTATDPVRRRGVLLGNPGGPGGTGLVQGLTVSAVLAPDVLAQYDLIGMDPRGVGRSTPVDCGWPVDRYLRAPGPGVAGFAREVALQADLAARCAAALGDTMSAYTTRNTARDMNVIRAALGEPAINYYGMSYGTYLGAVFAQMFPDRIDRLVLDSAIDPGSYGSGESLTKGASSEAALDDWAAWAAGQDARYHLGTTAAEVRSRIEGLVRRVTERPIDVSGHTVDGSLLPLLLYFPLHSYYVNDSYAVLVRQLLDAADGRPVTLGPGDWLTAYFDTADTEVNSSAEAAIECGDAGVPRDPQWYWTNIERARATQPIFGALSNNITPCAFWPAPAEPPTVVRNALPALIVQATGDPRTPLAGAEALRRAMTGARLLTVPGMRAHVLLNAVITDLFDNGRVDDARLRCVRDATNEYLRDGTLPASDVTC
ncbi:alpha/beta hydrolase [Nocardia brasiliensis]|uniref:alpha/beta hydrolase n=1 Tax=Nocardia brasiliensis TaxID=37326 RepID=UPI0036710475